MGEAALAQQIASFEDSTLGSLMSTAVVNLRDPGRSITDALGHVQEVLQIPSRADVEMAIVTLQQLALAMPKTLQKALDVIEGFGAVGLHAHTTFAPMLSDLLREAARHAHRDDLAFVLEVAREVREAKPAIPRCWPSSSQRCDKRSTLPRAPALRAKTVTLPSCWR
jgi:hypothetical protein